MLWGWQWRVRKEREREGEETAGGYDELAMNKTRMTVA